MNKKEALKEGLKYACLECYTVYKTLPTEDYEDGHGGRKIAMCKCGSDLFINIETDKPAYYGE